MTDRQAKKLALSIVEAWEVHNLRYRHRLFNDDAIPYGARALTPSDLFRHGLLEDHGGRRCWFLGGPLDGQQVEVPRGLDFYRAPLPGAGHFSSATATYFVECCVYSRKIITLLGRGRNVFVSEEVGDWSIPARLNLIIERRVQEYEEAIRSPHWGPEPCEAVHTGPPCPGRFPIIPGLHNHNLH